MSRFNNVKIKRGTLYMSSKTQEDDSWTKQEFNIGGKDIVSYHKELSMEGKLSRVELYEDRFAGNCLRVSVEDQENRFFILDIPIVNKNSTVGATNEFFQSAVGALENISKGDEITIFVNNKNKDKDDRLYRNLVFLDADKKLIKSTYQFTDVPSWDKEVTEDKLSGKETIKWNPEAANDFFFEKTKEIIERLGNKGIKTAEDIEGKEKEVEKEVTPNNKAKTTAEAFGSPEPSKEKPKKVSEISSDDLPF